MVKHVSRVFNDCMCDVRHGCDAAFEFIKRVAVFPPLAHAVAVGHDAQCGGGDAFVNGLGFIHFEQIWIVDSEPVVFEPPVGDLIDAS